jgi:hypothetical protein
VAHYADGLWRHYGLTVLTVWDVESDMFESFVEFIDDQRARAQREAD